LNILRETNPEQPTNSGILQDPNLKFYIGSICLDVIIIEIKFSPKKRILKDNFKILNNKNI
jgi:hypothetical protein